MKFLWIAVAYVSIVVFLSIDVMATYAIVSGIVNIAYWLRDKFMEGIR